ncbi:hypothetical protein IIB79_03935 [candidate division KSB1 bacterium]|nr:hypothetical protein [candidate division KSB1 bacterium]
MRLIEKNFFPVYCRQYMLSLAALIIIVGCSKKNQDPIEISSMVVETDDYIEVTGLGAGSVSAGYTEAEARRNAADIAYFQALEILSEVIQGIAVRGEMTLRDLRMREGELAQVVQTKLRGVSIDGSTRFEQQEDGSWLAAVTIRWDKKNASTFAAELRNSEIINNRSIDESSSNNYSGIILDLRYIYGYNALLAPKIITREGRLLISAMNIKPDYLISNYGISIFSTINEAVKSGNVGEYPMKLVPKEYDAVTGSIILSHSDAQKLSDSPVKDNLIKQGKIALIL